MSGEDVDPVGRGVATRLGAARDEPVDLRPDPFRPRFRRHGFDGLFRLLLIRGSLLVEMGSRS